MTHTAKQILNGIFGYSRFRSPQVEVIETLIRGGDTLGEVVGFSLHAGVAAKAHERKKLERLCRYINRPAVSEKRLSCRFVEGIEIKGERGRAVLQ